MISIDDTKYDIPEMERCPGCNHPWRYHIAKEWASESRKIWQSSKYLDPIEENLRLICQVCNKLIPHITEADIDDNPQS